MRPGTTSKASAPRPEPLARHEEDSSSESENEIQPEAAAEEAPARRGGRTVVLSPMWRRGQMAALQLLRKKALQRLNEATRATCVTRSFCLPGAVLGASTGPNPLLPGVRRSGALGSVGRTR